MWGRGAGDGSGSKGGLGAAGTSPRSSEVPGVLGTPKQGASLWRPGLAGGDQGDAGRRGRSGRCRGGSIPKAVVLAWCPSHGEDAVLPKVRSAALGRQLWGVLGEVWAGVCSDQGLPGSSGSLWHGVGLVDLQGESSVVLELPAGGCSLLGKVLGAPKRQQVWLDHYASTPWGTRLWEMEAGDGEQRRAPGTWHPWVHTGVFTCSHTRQCLHPGHGAGAELWLILQGSGPLCPRVHPGQGAGTRGWLRPRAWHTVAFSSCHSHAGVQGENVLGNGTSEPPCTSQVWLAGQSPARCSPKLQGAECFPLPNLVAA